MNLLRHPIARSGCAGLISATAVSLNLAPAMAAVQLRQRFPVASSAIGRMGSAIDRLAIATIPVEPIPVASTPVHAERAKTAEKATAEAALDQKTEPEGTEAALDSLDAGETLPLTIRVKVGEAVQGTVQFAASTQAVLNAGDQSFELTPNTLYAAVASPQGIHVGEMTVSSLEIDPGADEYVFVGDRWYYGKLYLVLSEEGILSVNELPLEAYLYSVVGAEMPSNWNAEALKAQAIAARSYAVTHIERPASDWYDLGDDERWQAYKGGDSMHSNAIAAVQATLGQVLSQNGKVHEAQYAATEAISREAHGGVGMSQYGAQDLALTGNSYLQILGRYYPGTAIALVQ